MTWSFERGTSAIKYRKHKLKRGCYHHDSTSPVPIPTEYAIGIFTSWRTSVLPVRNFSFSLNYSTLIMLAAPASSLPYPQPFLNASSCNV